MIELPHFVIFVLGAFFGVPIGVVGVCLFMVSGWAEDNYREMDKD